MGMDIDKARRDEPIDRINLTTTLASHLAHVADPIAVDRNVCRDTFGAGAVDDDSVSNHDVVRHAVLPRFGWVKPKDYRYTLQHIH